MESFSQRKGLKSIKSVMQVDSMDDALRNKLWNALTLFYWNKRQNKEESGYQDETGYQDEMDMLLKRLWHNYFKKPLDTLDRHWSAVYRKIRDYFFKCNWYEVYDFIEFVANNYPDRDDNLDNQGFMDHCNLVLKSELSAYRFVGGIITQMTSEEEIAEIEEALKVPKPFKPVKNHLKKALDLLTDRKSPDYSNSIKESISAVEAICKLIVKDEKATLGQALKEMEGKTKMHSALRKAFDSLYGYTSDSGGIRHALLSESNLKFEDAKFMLVSCSAFTNYLIAKISDKGDKI